MADDEVKKKSGPQRRLEYVKKWQKRLESDYAALRDKRRLAIKYRDSDPTIVAIIEGRSKVTTNDMQDAIDMAKPDILETIAGLDEPLKLDPDNGNVVEQVKKLQVLGNVMVKRKNRWYRICSNFLDDSMVLQFGCIKYRWVEVKINNEKNYEGLQDIELEAFKSQGASIVTDEIGDDNKRTTVLSFLAKEDEYVKYDSVPSERIRFPLDTRDFDETPITIEEIRLYKHEFIRDYGQKNFDKVEKAREALEADKPDPEWEARFKHVGGIDHFYDKKSDKYKVFESYFWEDDNPWVMTYACNDVILVDEKNKYGKPPYRGGSPFLIAHSLIGKGYYDLLKNIQEERTFLKRQIRDIITQNNYRRNWVNPEATGLNIDDYENNSAMNTLVRFTGYINDEVFREEQKIGLGNDVIAFYEMLKVEKDEHIPTPRAYQGVEGGQDERTYRGKQLKVNQAAKKLLMMMRSYMEEVFGPLFQDTLDCIAKFMKKSTVVRYLNEDYEISPEDIICKYALIVNVGLGSHDKQDLIVKLQQLIGLALQQMEQGIYTPQNLYYINQELVKAMGFLNTMDFVTDPKVKETVLQFIQLTMTAMQHFTEIHTEDPEMQRIIQTMMQMAQQVMTALGIKQKLQKGGENAKGTQPNQEPAIIQDQPANPMNPQTEITGGSFFA